MRHVGRQVIRNSGEVVEAGFDGDVAAMTALLTKGFHVESEDGHRHTALSEATCQGHVEMLQCLLSLLMEKKLQERLTSHVEREHVAKLRIRDDLVALASSTASTAAGELKDMLLGLAADAVVNADKPRGRSANSRDERGCTLLALAAQHDNADVATLLLTHWKAPHAKDTYIDVFRAQVNARDMKGWTLVAIAVFHKAKRTTRLLLQHGANPRLKNQVLDDSLHYKPLQFTLLDEWESEQLASTLENNRNKFSVGAAEPLPSDGGATLLAIEVAEEAQQKASSKKKVPDKKTKSKKTK
ncbi:hypothetical protein DYB25_000269 [Aphanomyces astaci]|uniref:Uncharacterized protein n=2 Tax=Aphanomyces astaci TaxID=112090 RepID=A0A397B9K8_APHAT|nr:hypothetical protein DYB25_000269 [Aphanomyces astaci]